MPCVVYFVVKEDLRPLSRIFRLIVDGIRVVRPSPRNVAVIVGQVFFKDVETNVVSELIRRPRASKKGHFGYS